MGAVGSPERGKGEMSNKIGRFEILSELAKSDSGCVYKASDPESGQVLALKTIRLEAYGEHAGDIEQRILAEAETTKDLTSPNITLVYGAGDIDGQFCAAMDYVQGNSIATMLARKEGFSIWDLLDISRQVCQGLDHAHEHGVFHLSLEPAKIMVTWDGTVKILSFGISSTGYVNAQAKGEPPSVLFYMSPEQVSGEALDGRSNLFSWGAMLYEMVTDQKAFDASDADGVRQKILEETPVAPAQLNPKINAIASNVIMKALAKDPAQRYQSGKELAADLDKCREAASKGTKAAAPKAPTLAPKAPSGAGSAKFAGPAKADPLMSAPAPSAPPAQKFAPAPTAAPSLSDELETSWTPPAPAPARTSVAAPKSEEAAKAAAAAAGWNGSSVARGPSLDPSAQFISATVRASVDALSREGANLSAGVVEEPQAEKPKIAIDPMMAEPEAGGAKTASFSELSELPPLKEVYVAPPRPKAEEAPADPALPSIIMRPGEPEKPKVDPREVAEKAINEIKGVPPKLMMYSIGGAVAIILVIGAVMAWHSYSQNTDEEGSVPKPVATAQQAAPSVPVAPEPAAPDQSAASTPALPEAQSAPAPTQAPAEVAPENKRVAKNASKARTGKNKKAAAPAPVAAVVPGQVAVDSTPEGAQIQLDGKSDPSWVTPFNLAGLAPGSHTIVVSKSGYGQETRTVDVAAASKTSVAMHLTQLNAVMSVSSDPAGASVIVDGKDTQKVTPTQVALGPGNHTILVRKTGYLDETTSATGQPGQAYHFAPTLRALGNVDDIKTVGKFKKLFGGGAVLSGMGKVSVHTLPKGAQVAINRRMLEKSTPVEFLLNPGNYVVDITETGYKPVQKVITVDKDGSVSIDETLQPE
jgi:eukaryotic-like serine/threonine-protein kinase